VVAVLSPMLPSFIARYREVRVIIDVDNGVIDMPLEPADLMIRVSAGMPDSNLIARHLLTTEVWTCASPGYLAACGTPSCVADLSLHTLIAYSDQPATWSYRTKDGAIQTLDLTPAHVVSDSVAMQPMLVGGAGIGRLPDFLAREAVAKGELVRLFAGAEGDEFGIHALYPSHRSLSAKVRVFIDAVLEHIAAERPPQV
jgi:DNA-binding transcriptional LysR family regulator